MEKRKRRGLRRAGSRSLSDVRSLPEDAETAAEPATAEVPIVVDGTGHDEPTLSLDDLLEASASKNHNDLLGRTEAVDFHDWLDDPDVRDTSELPLTDLPEEEESMWPEMAEVEPRSSGELDESLLVVAAPLEIPTLDSPTPDPGLPNLGIRAGADPDTGAHPKAEEPTADLGNSAIQADIGSLIWPALRSELEGDATTSTTDESARAEPDASLPDGQLTLESSKPTEEDPAEANPAEEDLAEPGPSESNAPELVTESEAPSQTISAATTVDFSHPDWVDIEGGEMAIQAPDATDADWQLVDQEPWSDGQTDPENQADPENRTGSGTETGQMTALDLGGEGLPEDGNLNPTDSPAPRRKRGAVNDARLHEWVASSSPAVDEDEWLDAAKKTSHLNIIVTIVVIAALIALALLVVEVVG